MRRSHYLAIAGAIASALALAPALASASSAILTVGSTSGPAVAPGDSIMGTGSATFVNAANSSQKITCTSTIWAMDATNPSPPGAASVTVHSVTFDSCTVTGISGVTGINGVTTNATSTCPWNASIGDTTNPATVTVSPSTVGGCPTSIQGTINLKSVIGPISCVYQPHGGTISGTAKLGSSEGVRFTNAQFDKASGPGTCFTTGLFSALYTFVDGSGNPIFVN